MPSEGLGTDCILFFECNCFHGDAEFCCTWIMPVKPSSRSREVCISLAAALYLGLYFTFVAVVLRVSEQQQQHQSHWKWARSSVHPIWLNFPGFSGAVLHYTSSCSFEYLLYVCRKKCHFPAVTGRCSGHF